MQVHTKKIQSSYPARTFGIVCWWKITKCTTALFDRDRLEILGYTPFPMVLLSCGSKADFWELLWIQCPLIIMSIKNIYIYILLFHMPFDWILQIDKDVILAKWFAWTRSNWILSTYGFVKNNSVGNLSIVRN
jgi:hypothetical protein